MKISLHLQIGMMYNYFNVLVSTILLCLSNIYIMEEVQNQSDLKR